MHRFKLYIILCAFLWIIPVLSAYSQTPFLKQIPLFKGREDYNVNVVLQDNQGWIWFGTTKGLFRYDGINLDRYTRSDSIANDNITALGKSNTGGLWIGHRNGMISRYENNLFSVFRPEAGLGQVEVTDFVLDLEGNTWYSTLGEGIFKFDGRYLSNLNVDDGLSDNYVYDMDVDSYGTIWLASDYGITGCAEESLHVISMKDGLPDNIVRVIEVEEDGSIWLGTEEAGIAIYYPADTSISVIDGWQFGTINGFTKNLANELWVSTERQGIIKIYIDENEMSASYQQIKTEQGLISDRLQTIIKDSENNIWIAGKTGVVQALPPVFEFLNKNSGTPFEMVYSFTIDRKGRFWVSSELGLYRGQGDDYGSLSWTNVSEQAGLKSTNFISVYTASDGSIWTGTYGKGVYRFDPGGRLIANYSLEDGLLDNNVIHISGKGEFIWFSTLGGGVSGFNLNTGSILNYDDPVLNQSYIYAAVPDHNERVWLAGSMNSIGYIQNNEVHFLHDSTYAFSQLYGIAVDSSNTTWFNTKDKGLLAIRNDSILAYGQMDGIDFEEIKTIVFDKWNNLVILSDQGIKFFKPESGVITEYGENTGLAYQYPIENSVFTDDKGNIWIGTETGIIKYNPDYFNKLKQTPQIFLSSIQQFGKSLDKQKTKYRFNENNFTFRYTGLWYKNPEGLSYRYRLEGYDLDWSYSKRNQASNYSKLPAGDYCFEAQVSLDDKNWIQSKEASFSFIVMPPFWQRLWFIVSVIILIISGIYYYIRQRLSNLQKAKEELEKEVHKRTEEIRAQNEELETQKEEIAAQRDNAERQRDQIEHQSEEIQASIRYAHRIQSAALPPESFLDDVLGDHFILNKPRDIVSGDFYWIAKRKDSIFFAVGDCTGHGVPGAFMSMLGLSALNDIVKSLEVCKASEILDLLNERIRESLHQNSYDESRSQDGMDISICIYEPTSNKLQYAGAHNSLYIISEGIFNRVRADNMGIGSSVDSHRKFTNHELELNKRDIIYMFSDGYPDQFGGPKEKKYKSKQFREFLIKIHKKEMPEQRRLLDEEIEAWRGNIPQVDDIIVMGFKKN